MAFSNYGGYVAPSSVQNEDDVRRLQQQLGVQVDGLWGPKTQAAYEASMGGTASSIPSNYSNYLKDALAMIQQSVPTVSYTPMSREEIQADLTAALRPGYDLAIENRKKQTATNKANIDADAAARGMGASTWVTDVKDRQQDAEADDIAMMESNYNATLAQQLMSALQAERANKMAADQFNANTQTNALSTALGLAGQFYGNDLATAKTAASPRRNPEPAEENDDDEYKKMNVITAADELEKILKSQGEASAKAAYNEMLRQNLIVGTQSSKNRLWDELVRK